MMFGGKFGGRSYVNFKLCTSLSDIGFLKDLRLMVFNASIFPFLKIPELCLNSQTGELDELGPLGFTFEFSKAGRS